MHQRAARPRPIARNDRLQNLDLLRGLAVFASVPVLVEAFSALTLVPWPAPAGPDMQTAAKTMGDHLWIVNQLVFGSTVLALFGAAFGAGLVLSAERAARYMTSLANLPAWLSRLVTATGLNRLFGETAFGLHMRRMAVLAALGVVLSLTVWHGDLLLLFACAGTIAFFARTVSPGRLTAAAGTVLLAGSVLALWLGARAAQGEPLRFAQMMAGTGDLLQTANQSEYDALTGSFGGQIAWRLAHLADPMVPPHASLVFAQILSAMLLGMALYRWQVFCPNRVKSRHLFKVVTGFAIGVPLILSSIIRDSVLTPLPAYMINQGDVLRAWGALPLAAGEFGLIVLLSRIPGFELVKRAFLGLGQLALTNYLLVVTICAVIFYGANQLGQFGWAQTWTVIVLIWLSQVAFTLFWVAHCRLGPVEWLSRLAVYGGRQPLFVHHRASPS